MQRYIEQLIADIHQASWNLKPPHKLWMETGADPDDELELEDISFIEEYVEGEEVPIAGITGLTQEQLPPPEQLNEQQKALLAEELEKLLEVFHFKLEFPESFPAHLRYPFIRDFRSESHVALSFGVNHIEFCDYEEEHCPFAGYCNSCKEVTAEIKNDEQTGASATYWPSDVDDLLISREELEEWMREQHESLDEEAETDPFAGQQEPFISGIFDDNGNPVNPESIPVPGLCIVCKQYGKDDWDENLLCQMNRFDQRNDPDFQCGAFEKL